MTRSLPTTTALITWSLWAATGLGGCDPSLGPSGGSSSAWVELYTGELALEPLEQGQTLLVERGSQGGVHLWGSLRAGGLSRGSEDEYEALLSGDRPLVEFTLEAPYGLLSNDNLVRQYLQEDQEGGMILVGRRVIFRHYSELPEDWQQLDWEQVEQRIEQEDLTLRVTITDSRGRWAEDSRNIHVQFPPREQEQPG